MNKLKQVNKFKTDFKFLKTRAFTVSLTIDIICLSM